MTTNIAALAAIAAQAKLHHAYFIGLQLMVSVNRDASEIESWMFKLFRSQHEQKFLSSFEKLGLSELPDAIACARYHVLSNGIGGVPVEYMEEHSRKAWVRFRYPRWMYDGPALCGIPPAASRGFMRGWYAHNGVTLNNPRLGFVCVSDDLSGEFGFCGYFQEYDHDLNDAQRLRFAADELPPAFDASAQPIPPTSSWNEERLAKANRNYAMEFVRNGIAELGNVVGTEQAAVFARNSARLIGLQYYRETAAIIGAKEGDANDAASYLATMLSGLGDDASVLPDSNAKRAVVRQRGQRLTRGLGDDAASVLFDAWSQLWVGTIRAHQQLLDLELRRVDEDTVEWCIFDRRGSSV